MYYIHVHYVDVECAYLLTCYNVVHVLKFSTSMHLHILKHELKKFITAVYVFITTGTHQWPSLKKLCKKMLTCQGMLLLSCSYQLSQKIHMSCCPLLPRPRPSLQHAS